MSEKIAVCGAGGYVGRHLVAALVEKGFQVRAITREPEVVYPGASNFVADLLDFSQAQEAIRGATQVYNLAATVGGIGFIQKNPASCMSSAAININLLRARSPELKGYFFASSSCIYPSQDTPLSEDAVRPEELVGYGLEKYFSEETCLAFRDDHGVPVRIARLHTVYGLGDFRGTGRDHFPSAMALQVAEAVRSGIPEIKIWGSGLQTRSLLYIDDAVEGIQRLMNSSCDVPVNLASSETVSVNGVVDALEEIAAVKLTRFYSPGAVIGAQNKTADTSLLRAKLGWEPCTPARTGLERLYRSVWDRVLKS